MNCPRGKGIRTVCIENALPTSLSMALVSPVAKRTAARPKFLDRLLYLCCSKRIQKASIICKKGGKTIYAGAGCDKKDNGTMEEPWNREELNLY